jgi:hypothetical protein
MSLFIFGTQTILLNGADTRSRTTEYSSAVSGRILDSQSGTPVPGNQRRLVAEDGRPVTLFEQPPAVRPGGRFSLWNLPSGEYRLAVRGLPAGYHAGRPVAIEVGDRVTFVLL